MTIRSAMQEGYSMLLYAEVETPLLDAVVLLAKTMNVTKEKLYASFCEDVEESLHATYLELLHMRCGGLPVSYILKRKEFYGLEFFVDERVLVPRPDTEIAVETAARLAADHPAIRSIHDLCTGSGCIAITLKTLLPGCDISASDISAAALEVFDMNCARLLPQRIPSFRSDLLSGVAGTFDLIVSNPPYVEDGEVEAMVRTGWPEPVLALKGGEDGLAVTERVVAEASARLNPGGFLVLESSPPLMDRITSLMTAAGFTAIRRAKDLGGRDRVICGGLG
jgi:release factor glutamine methyltransferase